MIFLRKIFGLLLLSGFAYGQKQGNIWVFGQGGAVDFNSGSPVAFSGSQVFGNPTQSGDYLYSEGCASISDSSGTLLFYSNGEKVWNKFHQKMPNGDSLKGFYSSTNAAFIIPVPLSDSLYYLFTTDGIERYLQKGLRYSIINMCLDNGKGDIILTQKNILLLDTVSEKLCAVAHPNGTDVWLIAHKFFSDAFYAYQITPTGINPPVISHIGSIHVGNLTFYNGCGGAIGQMKASPNGSRIGLAFANKSPEVVEVFDFNKTTGIISNSLSLTSSIANYGVEFSPDNSKFYLTSANGIFQFDLTSGNQTTINASKTLITNVACLPGPLQLGPDNKIYAARCNSSMSVINAPNNLGTACNIVVGAINISPCTNNSSLPAFIAGYNYKNTKIPNCLSNSISEISPKNSFKLYPNPIHQTSVLEFNLPIQTRTLKIFNLQGQLVTTIENIKDNHVLIERQSLSSGLYFFTLQTDNALELTGKLSVE